MKGDKRPTEAAWTSVEHKNMEEWKQWIQDGLNVGVRCGKVSGLTVIDLDHMDTIPQEICDLVGVTLVAKTTSGFHLFYQYCPDLPVTRIQGMSIDILGDGRQCVIEPSVVSGVARRFITERDPIEIPTAFKEYLISKTQRKRVVEEVRVVEEGTRNNSLTNMGGILRKFLNMRQTTKVLHFLNDRFISPPISNKDVETIGWSLEKYRNVDDSEFVEQVWKYFRMVEEATAYDCEKHFGETRERIDKAIAELCKEDYIVRKNNKYQIVTTIEWKSYKHMALGEDLPYNIPYFGKLSNFYWGDFVLLGASTGSGKTHITMNIVKQLVDSGLEPYLITTENIARTFKLARSLGIEDGAFKYAYVPELKRVSFPNRKIIVLDWLQIEDFSDTHNIIKYISEQIQESQSFLICLAQLQWGNDWFAKNLIHHYPALSVRFILDKDDRRLGAFHIDKNRDPKPEAVSKMQMEYDPFTRLLKEREESEIEKVAKETLKGDWHEKY